MAIELTPQEREIGKANFHRAVGHQGVTRRDFMGGLLAAGAVVPISAAAYYGYQKLKADPVKVALIGAGDEGGVLVGEHNPDYLRFVAVCDIRPTSLKGIFDGAPPKAVRKGFIEKYGANARKDIAVFTNYKQMLEECKDIEAVVIALPLHLHAQVTIDCLNAGKHVLCEKLMAWNVAQCKDMIKAAEANDRILSIGHQRHYSLLYAQCVEVMRSGEIGEVRHIRAFWHRNNARPKLDKDGKQIMVPYVDVNTGQAVPGKMIPAYQDGWFKDIPEEDRKALQADIRKHGYRSMEELLRWRVYHRTGGGLMAELGSHQLDACSIFLGKVKPLAVSGIGGKLFYKDDREAEDHVFCTFEFPGKNYWADPSHTQVNDKNDIVVVTYSSINTNAYEPYGECVMGTQGTLIVEKEADVMLYSNAGRAAAMTVSQAGAGKPAVDSSSTYDTQAAAKGAASLGSGPVSKGYREEMEHFAYCVKMWQDKNVAKEERPQPRCNGVVAMADAIIALTSNLAMRGTKESGGRPQRIEFQKEWFDPTSAAVPDKESKVEAVS
jgi:predicted dehydrogenase